MLIEGIVLDLFNGATCHPLKTCKNPLSLEDSGFLKLSKRINNVRNRIK